MFKILPEDTLPNGDIFNAPQELKVVTINTQGAMGRGIALSAKQNYPESYKIYRERFQDKKLMPEEVWCIKLDVVNLAMFPTKVHWRQPSPPALIRDNIPRLKKLMEVEGFKSVAIPPLGMVNGWIRDDDAIRELVLTLRETFRLSELEAILYVPQELYVQLKKIFNIP